MDDLSLAFYQMKYELAYLSKKANEFQDFFADIMEKAYPADFVRVRPWGNVGDRKNDGYVSSIRTLFQVYGPNEMTSASAISKIDEDFQGALPFWEDYFDNWIFVHNSAQGLGPDVLEKLLALDQSQEDVSVRSWGKEELRRVVFGLEETDLLVLLGPIPTRQDMLNLGLSDLNPILDQISIMPKPEETDLRPPPSDKIEINMLSQHVESCLKAGMVRADLVQKYFRSRPLSRDAIAQRFRMQYDRLVVEEMSPDDIFTALMRFAGGDLIPSASRLSATFAVLAYFFEGCDIYERGESDS